MTSVLAALAGYFAVVGKFETRGPIGHHAIAHAVRCKLRANLRIAATTDSPGSDVVRLVLLLVPLEYAGLGREKTMPTSS